MKSLRATSVTLTFFLACAIAGCGDKQPPAQTAPVEVNVLSAVPQSVPLTREAVGRLSATRSADVRARVAGVLLERLYREGSQVKAGQPLFQIDPKPLQAEVDRAAGALASAEADATNARIVAERAQRLVNDHLISQADFDTAEANERSAAARVKEQSAALQTARIRLNYAKVTAPIDGQAGQQQVTEGALVGENGATLLTTIEQIDPIYVNFDQPSDAIEELRRAQADGVVRLLAPQQMTIELMQPDGQPSGTVGKLDYSGITVDPTTGAVPYRATLPNPDRRWLPGMFVNLRVTLGSRGNAFLVPQSALLRDANGPYVLAIDAAGQAVQKRVTTEGQQNSNWVVSAGLSEGDQIIVSGLGTLRAGQAVKAVKAAEGAPTATTARAQD
jgi:membrane fusion protein (multidrug efflux system)